MSLHPSPPLHSSFPPFLCPHFCFQKFKWEHQRPQKLHRPPVIIPRPRRAATTKVEDERDPELACPSHNQDPDQDHPDPLTPISPMDSPWIPHPQPRLVNAKEGKMNFLLRVGVCKSGYRARKFETLPRLVSMMLNECSQRMTCYFLSLPVLISSDLHLRGCFFCRGPKLLFPSHLWSEKDVECCKTRRYI